MPTLRDLELERQDREREFYQREGYPLGARERIEELQRQRERTPYAEYVGGFLGGLGHAAMTPIRGYTEAIPEFFRSPEGFGPSRAELAGVQQQAEEDLRQRVAGGTVPSEVLAQAVQEERRRALAGAQGPLLGETAMQVTAPLRAAGYAAASPYLGAAALPAMFAGMEADPEAMKYLPGVREFETGMGGLAGGIRGYQTGEGILGGTGAGALAGLRGERRPGLAETLPEEWSPATREAIGTALEFAAPVGLHGAARIGERLREGPLVDLGEGTQVRRGALEQALEDIRREAEIRRQQQTSRLMPGEQPRPIQVASVAEMPPDVARARPLTVAERLENLRRGAELPVPATPEERFAQIRAQLEGRQGLGPAGIPRGGGVTGMLQAGGDVREVNPSEVHADPERFQYKREAIGEGGTTPELHQVGKWDPVKAELGEAPETREGAEAPPSVPPSGELPLGAGEPEVAPTGPEVRPPAPKLTGPTRDIDVARAFYRPGTYVQGYGGIDKVIAFNEHPNGRWSVIVQEVDPATGEPTGPRREHATLPTERQTRTRVTPSGALRPTVPPVPPTPQEPRTVSGEPPVQAPPTAGRLLEEKRRGKRPAKAPSAQPPGAPPTEGAPPVAGPPSEAGRAPAGAAPEHGGAGGEPVLRAGEETQGIQPRIVTSREPFTRAEDVSGLDPGLAQHLNDPQKQGVAKAVRAIDETGGFLLADGTGVGKTRQILATAQHYARLGQKVLIVAPAEVLKVTKGRISGSYADDSKAMGVTVRYLEQTPSELEPGTINITKYNSFKDVPVDGNTVLIYDEAHYLKNADSARAQAGIRKAADARGVLYATATPGDKIEHMDYLWRIGTFEGRSREKAYYDLGLIEKRVKGRNGQMVTVWAVNPKVGKMQVLLNLERLFERLTERGTVIKREIGMDGVDVDFRTVQLPEEGKRVLQKIEDEMAGGDVMSLPGLAKANVLGHLRRQQEPYKVRDTVAMTQEELAKGRQVIIFIARVNDSAVVKRIKQILPSGETEKIEQLIHESEGTSKLMRRALTEAGIKDVAELHSLAETSGQESMRDFQSGKKKVLIATIESGGTGINLDDRAGNAPRTMIVVTSPFGATEAVQAAGRVWRMTTRSHPSIRFLFTDHLVDRWNASIIASKLKTLGATVRGQVERLDIPEGFLPEDYAEQQKRQTGARQDAREATEPKGIHKVEEPTVLPPRVEQPKKPPAGPSPPTPSEPAIPRVPATERVPAEAGRPVPPAAGSPPPPPPPAPPGPPPAAPGPEPEGEFMESTPEEMAKITGKREAPPPPPAPPLERKSAPLTEKEVAGEAFGGGLPPPVGEEGPPPKPPTAKGGGEPGGKGPEGTRFYDQFKQKAEPSLWEKIEAFPGKLKDWMGERLSHGYAEREYPEFVDNVRVVEAQVTGSTHKIHEHIRRMLMPTGKPLTVPEYETFARLAVFENLDARIAKGTKALPYGVTPEWVRGELAKWRAKATPAVKAALAAHWDLMRVVGQDLVRRGRMRPESMRDRYFPHLVSDEVFGDRVLGRPERVKYQFRGYTKQALGSERPLVGDYVEAMGQHLGRVLRDNAIEDFINLSLRKYGVNAKGGKARPEGSRLFVPGMGRALDAEGIKLTDVPPEEARVIEDAIQHMLDGTEGSAQALANILGSVDKARAVIQQTYGRVRYWVPEPIYAKMMDFTRDMKDHDLRGIHDVVRWLKMVQTTGQLGKFQFRNMLGDLADMYREDVSSLSWTHLKEAWSAIAQQRLYRNNVGKASPLYELSDAVGVTRAGFYGAEVGRMFDDPVLNRYRQQGQHGPLRRLWGTWERFTNERENFGRIAMFATKLDELSPGWRNAREPAALAKLAKVREAAKIAREFSTDYGKLTPFERKYMSGLFVPYWQWYKQQTLGAWPKYFARHPLKSGLKFVLPLYLLWKWNSTGRNKEVEENLPQYVRGQFHFITGLKDPTSGKPIVFNMDMPWDELREIIAAEDLPSRVERFQAHGWKQLPVQLRETLTAIPVGLGRKLSPLVTSAMYVWGNWDSFYDRPILTQRELELTPEEKATKRAWYLLESQITPLRMLTSASRRGTPTGVIREFPGIPLSEVDVERGRSERLARLIKEEAQPFETEQARRGIVIEEMLNAGQRKDQGAFRKLYPEAVQLWGSPEAVIEALRKQKKARKTPARRAFEETPSAAREEIRRRVEERLRNR